MQTKFIIMELIKPYLAYQWNKDCTLTFYHIKLIHRVDTVRINNNNHKMGKLNRNHFICAVHCRNCTVLYCTILRYKHTCMLQYSLNKLLLHTPLYDTVIA